MSELKSGESAPHWKGGVRLRNGYYEVYFPDHPRAYHKYIPYHIVVMELSLKRYLNKKEEVHHKNHNKLDNRIENLQLCKDHNEHMAQHRQDRMDMMKIVLEKRELEKHIR